MLNIYSPELKKIGVIADYESLIIDSRFYKTGNFEIYININKQYTEELTIFNIIQVNNRKDRAGMILHKSLPLSDSGKSGETLFISGIMLDGLLNNFTIVPGASEEFMAIEGRQEYIMKEFVYRNMINNSIDQDRNIDFLTLSNNKNLGDVDKWRGRFNLVGELIEEIGIYSELGYNILLDDINKKMIFDVVKGVDRTINNGSRTPVIFELSFGNVITREYTEDITNSANIIYGGGTGEGIDKLIQKVGSGKGIKRIEKFIDYSNIADVSELKSKAIASLKELEEKVTFSVQANPRGSFIYEEDYNLGDYVTVRDNELGIEMNTQITEVKEINEGQEVEITFGQSVPTVTEKLKRKDVVK